MASPPLLNSAVFELQLTFPSYGSVASLAMFKSLHGERIVYHNIQDMYSDPQSVTYYGSDICCTSTWC